jgi:hypothetical protein
VSAVHIFGVSYVLLASTCLIWTITVDTSGTLCSMCTLLQHTFPEYVSVTPLSDIVRCCGYYGVTIRAYYHLQVTGHHRC